MQLGFSPPPPPQLLSPPPPRQFKNNSKNMKAPLLRSLLERALYRFRVSHRSYVAAAAVGSLPPPAPIFHRTTTPIVLRFLSTTPIRQQQQQQQQPQQQQQQTVSIPPPLALLPTPTSHTLTTSPLFLFPLLKKQPLHYVTIHINSFPFLVTSGDLVTLPFRLLDVQVGDILRLTHISLLGSRDFTLKGSPWIEEDLFELRARVVEVTSEPMRFKIKKKQRTRRTKTVKSKHKYTVLRIGELILKGGDGVKVEARNAVEVGAEAEVGMRKAEHV